MPDHVVKFTVPYRVLGRSDVKFKIYAKQRRAKYLIGTLLVSHGAIEWRAARKWKQNSIKLAWPDFDKLMRGR